MQYVTSPGIHMYAVYPRETTERFLSPYPVVPTAGIPSGFDASRRCHCSRLCRKKCVCHGVMVYIRFVYPRIRLVNIYICRGIRYEYSYIVENLSPKWIIRPRSDPRSIFQRYNIYISIYIYITIALPTVRSAWPPSAVNGHDFLADASRRQRLIFWRGRGTLMNDHIHAIYSRSRIVAALQSSS